MREVDLDSLTECDVDADAVEEADPVPVAEALSVRVVECVALMDNVPEVV